MLNQLLKISAPFQIRLISLSCSKYFSKPFWFLKYALREWESIAFFQKREKKMIDKRTKLMFK